MLKEHDGIIIDGQGRVKIRRPNKAFLALYLLLYHTPIWKWRRTRNVPHQFFRLHWVPRSRDIFIVSDMRWGSRTLDSSAVRHVLGAWLVDLCQLGVSDSGCSRNGINHKHRDFSHFLCGWQQKVDRVWAQLGLSLTTTTKLIEPRSNLCIIEDILISRIEETEIIHRLSKIISWKPQNPSLNLQQLRSQSSPLKPVHVQIETVARSSKTPIFHLSVIHSTVRAIFIAMVVTVQNQTPVQSGKKVCHVWRLYNASDSA